METMMIKSEVASDMSFIRSKKMKKLRHRLKRSGQAADAQEVASDMSFIRSKKMKKLRHRLKRSGQAADAQRVIVLLVARLSRQRQVNL